ncbi:MAG: hypothetical protein AB1730_05635 [Myxococcota bacterium]|jgi:hypothetical protein
MSLRLALLVAAVLSSTALAQQAAPAAAPEPPPPADEIKRVLDYQENGKDRGPALLELVPCTRVDTSKGSETANTCIEPVTGPVKKGTTVFAWTLWFCPKGGKYEDVMIQFLHEGQVRSTVDITIQGLARTRTWRGYSLTKPGKWEIKILRGAQEVGGTTVQVQP